MKKITLLLASISLAFLSHAQNCTPNGISTDWLSPIPNSPPVSRSFEKNTFDWTQINFIRHNTYQPIYDNPFTIRSPFYDLGNSAAYRTIAKFENSDFQPADGWELIKQDMGYLSTGMPNTVLGSSRIPYIILYNKVSGTLRFMFEAAYDLNYDGSSGFIVELKFTKSLALDSKPLTVSGILNHNGATSLPLSEVTTATEVRVPIPKAISGKMAFADFQMAYDPCTCYYGTNLEFNISGISTSNITMSGRALGAITAIDDKTDDFYGYDSQKNYLNSVLTNGQNNFSTGASMYNSWTNLQNSYENQVSELEKINSDANTLEAVGAGATSIGSVVAGIPSNGVTQVVGGALVAIGTMSTFFSSRLRSSVDEPIRPMALHAEIALSGTITKVDPLGQSIQIVNPGSSESKTAPEYSTTTGYSYPMYNEVLGTFALLQTPVVKYFRGNVFNSPVSNNYAANQVQLTNGAIQKHELQLDLSSLKFAFNPALDVDEDKTEIYYALVSEFSYGTANVDYSLIYGMNFNKLFDYKQGPTSGYYAKCISNFQPIECTGTSVVFNAATRVILNTDGSNYPVPKSNLFSSQNVFLRLMVKLRTKPNSKYNNQVNEALQIFTYPVSLQNTDSDLTASFLPNQSRVLNSPNPCDIIVLGSGNGQGINWANFVNMTAGASCGGLRNYYFLAPVTISGDMNTLQGTRAEIYSLGDIHLYSPTGRVEMNPETSLNPQFGIDLKTNGGCTSKVYSVNKDGNYNFQNFCADGNKYKAKTAPASRQDSESNKPKEALESGTTKVVAIPNPSSGLVRFLFKTELNGMAIIEIYNTYGTKVGSTEIVSVSKSVEQYVDFDGSSLSSGLYIYKLQTNEQTLGIGRLVIVK